MTLLHRPATDGSTGPAKSVEQATAAETALMLVGGTWLVIGLFIDGYAHTEIIDTETEDFFTPWHGLFYSGFLFTVAVMARMARRRAAPLITRRSLPPGYGLAGLGLGLFAVGGVGDGIWHTLFGVESGLDALLSPTHLLLFVGMILILTAPARSSWLDPRPRRGWRALGSVVASAAITTALIAFFFVYAFGLFKFEFHRIPYDSRLELNGEVVNEHLVQLGLARAYVGTALLLLPTLLFVRRWTPPVGAIATIWTAPVALTVLGFDGDLWAVAATALGGLAFELIFRVTIGRTDRSRAIRWTATIGTAVLWTIWLAFAAVAGGGIGWPIELWSGQIGTSALVAFALAFLATPRDSIDD